jgi:hypothetical protein
MRNSCDVHVLDRVAMEQNETTDKAAAGGVYGSGRCQNLFTQWYAGVVTELKMCWQCNSSSSHPTGKCISTTNPRRSKASIEYHNTSIRPPHPRSTTSWNSRAEPVMSRQERHLHSRIHVSGWGYSGYQHITDATQKFRD